MQRSGPSWMDWAVAVTVWLSLTAIMVLLLMGVR